MSGKNPEIAFLVYAPMKKRRKNNSFDGNDNIGANVIAEILKRSGHLVGFCDAATARDYRVVLVSLTSTYDVFAFFQEVALRPEWQPGQRQFSVVAGGFGMQNPYTIRDFVDYAVFGRAEGFVAGLVETVIGGGVFGHESVMRLPDIHSVKIAQAENLIDFEIKTKNGRWREDQIGCPNKCRFCHYTWARKWSNRDRYVLDGDLYRGSVEILLKDYADVTKKPSMLKSAIDGFSERLRYVYGKKISDQDILDSLEHFSMFDGTTRIKLYNISNFPGECEDDKKKFVDLINRVKNKNRISLKIHTTPLIPSLATPLQFAKVSLYPDWNVSGYSDRYIRREENFLAYHSAMNTGAWPHLQECVAIRATAETDKLFRTICFSKKLKSKTSEQKIKALQANFDLDPYIRRYDPDEDNYPGWWLGSYLPQDALKKAFLWTEKQLETPRLLPRFDDDEKKGGK